MMKEYRHIICVWVIIFFAAMITGPGLAAADSARKINRESEAALKKLFSESPAAAELAKTAKAILVFPGMGKAGFIVGGQYGEGALFKQGNVAGYYNSVSLSYGLQAGIQKYSYVLFFMTDSALAYLDKSGGWEIGVGPSIVVVDKGAATGLSTTTAKADIYAFFFGQKGLMAGLGLQGTKITRIDK